jgi:hypothetical protein
MSGPEREDGRPAGSLGTLRERNRLRVVDALRRRRRSRAGSPRDRPPLTTVATLVGDLHARGLVVDAVEDDPPVAGRSRPPELLRLNPSAGATVGVDYDHEHLRMARRPVLDRPRRARA